MLTIKRNSDTRVVKCIMHRVADIVGGVTVDVSKCGGALLREGTPMGEGSNGLKRVVKTVKVVAATSATTDTQYKVEKGHHFIAGDKISDGVKNAQEIASIDKSNAAYDVITVSTTLGGALAIGDVLFEAATGAKTLAVTPTCIAGSTYDVEANSNLFVDAWVMAVVKASNAPAVNAAIKTALPAVIYV